MTMDNSRTGNPPATIACNPGKIYAMQIQPYLFYNGRCDEAIAFYRAAVGAEVTMLMRFKESPEPAVARRRRQGDAREPPHRGYDAAGF